MSYCNNPLGPDIQAHIERRRAVLHRMEPRSQMWVPAASPQYHHRDVAFPFRQNSDFWYLTGLNEPDSILVLTKDEAGSCKSLLFCLPKDPQKEQWDGPRLGPRAAVDEAGFDEAFPLTTLESWVLAHFKQHPVLYYSLGSAEWLDRQWMTRWLPALRRKEKGPSVYQSIREAHSLLHPLRLSKTPLEIEHLRKAIDISVHAHRTLMQTARPGMMEYQLSALFQYEIERAGARHLAYPSIVAAGQNACVLHYVRCDAKLNQGDLLLVDAGAEWQGYAADITRTYPIGQPFSGPQKATYELVLAAQEAGIEAAQLGRPYSDIQKAILSVFTLGLVDLKVFLSLSEAEKGILKYYPHRSGHWLGLDVHDVGPYAEPKLTPHCVFTIEPGLYFPPDDEEIPAELKGIGIRIEDDIWMSEEGPVVLSEALPKSIPHLEAL